MLPFGPHIQSHGSDFSCSLYRQLNVPFLNLVLFQVSTRIIMSGLSTCCRRKDNTWKKIVTGTKSSQQEETWLRTLQ